MAIDLDDPEVKAAIKAAADEAVAGLKRKNDDLLAELKGFRKGTAVSVDAEELAALRTRAADADRLEGELKTANKTHATELRKRDDALASETAFSQRMMVDGGLAEALAKANVAPQALPALKSMFKERTKIEVNGDERKALIDGKPVAEFVAAWAASEEGKFYVTAPVSSGAGAPGASGSGTPGPKTMRRADFEKLAPVEQAKLGRIVQLTDG